MANLQRSAKAPIRCILPRKLDPKSIFCLDVDDRVWQDDPGLGDDPCESLPRWQGDDNTRDGIIQMQERDRCLEEQERIRHEHLSLKTWLEEESRTAQMALAANQGL